jgi:hypothetical protein
MESMHSGPARRSRAWEELRRAVAWPWVCRICCFAPNICSSPPWMAASGGPPAAPGSANGAPSGLAGYASDRRSVAAAVRPPIPRRSMHRTDIVDARYRLDSLQLNN